MNDSIKQIRDFHLILDRDDFLKVAHECFRFGIDDAGLYSILVAEERLVLSPRVFLIEEATRDLGEESWRRWIKYLTNSKGKPRSLKVKGPAEGDHFNHLDIGLAGAEVLLAIWDDKTIIFKVELEYRWSENFEEESNGFWAEEVTCVGQHPFVTVGTLLEGVDLERAGRDLLWRWLNPTAPGEPNKVRDVGLAQLGYGVYLPKGREAGKVYSQLVGMPLFRPMIPGVIRPMLEPDL